MYGSPISTLLGRVAAFCVLAAASSLFGAWQYLPAGQPEISVFATDSSGQVIWLGTGESGLWLSQDGGASWMPASDRLAPEGGSRVWSALTLDASADTVAISGFSRSTPPCSQRSFNGGLSFGSFVPPTSSQGLGHLAISPHVHNLWFYMADGNWRSLDCGVTWTPFATGHGSGGWYQYIDPQEDSTVFILASGYRNGATFVSPVWRSDDLGDTWQSALPDADFPEEGYYAASTILRMSNGELLVFMEYQPFDAELQLQLYVSSNDGLSWTALEGTGNVRAWESLIEDPLIPGRLYEDGGLRSEDYGRTWYAYGDLPSGESIWEFYQNPFSGFLYAGTSENRLFRSLNHGDHWELLSLPPVGTPWGEFLIDDQAVIANTNGEVERPEWLLEAPWENWETVNQPPVSSDSVMHNSPTRMVIADTLYKITSVATLDSVPYQWSSRVARSWDRGQTWFIGLNLDHVLGFGTGDVFTTQTGARWLEAAQGHEWQDTLLMSQDRGLTWQQIGSFADRILEILQTESAIYATTGMWGGGAYLQRTTNLGVTWEALGPSQPIAETGPVLLDDSLFAIRNGYCVVWNGSGWEGRGPLPHSNLVTVGFVFVAVPEGSGSLVGAMPDSTWLWVSDDHGVTWQPRHFELAFEHQCRGINELAYDPYRHRLWSATSVGYCYLDIAELSAEGPLVFKPADYTLLAVYPNPFNSVAKIRYDLLKAQRVELKIYDVTGRLVRTVADEVQIAGRHETRIEMGEMASGVYFVRLEMPEVVKTEKMLMIK